MSVCWALVLLLPSIPQPAGGGTSFTSALSDSATSALSGPQLQIHCGRTSRKFTFKIYRYTIHLTFLPNEICIRNVGTFSLSKNNVFNIVRKFTITMKYKRFVPFQVAVMLLSFEDQVSEGLHFLKILFTFQKRCSNNNLKSKLIR